MRHIERQALVPFSAAQMYALVDAVARYPEFLPWCRSVKELTRTPAEVTASIEVHKGALNTHFTTRNTLTPMSAIRMERVEGPFKTLHGEWRFTDIVSKAVKKTGGKGSRVDLSLHFAFSNPLNAWVLEPVFEHTCNTLIDAFVKRAREIYG